MPLLSSRQLLKQKTAMERALLRLLVQLDRLGSHRYLCVIGVGVAVVLLRLALLPFLPIPHAWMGDEFSYLLGADTFASGRLTNPTPPLWRSFEALHVIMQPTYMSKYPPGQSAFLAVGQVVFGHPYWGVVLGMALFCAAVCWMLQIFVPPGWTVVAAALTFAVFGVNYYWMESYWGGGLAAFGGCLITGSAFRILRKSAPRYFVLLALGIVVVFFTRPFEGGVFSIAVLVALGVYLWQIGRHKLLRQLIVTALGVVAITASLQAYYDWRVTGSPLTMPYLVHERIYTAVPTFWFQPLKTDIERPSDPVLAGNHWYWELSNYQEVRAIPAWRRLATMIRREVGLIPQLLGAIATALWLIPVFWRDFRIRFLCYIALPVVFFSSLAVYAHTHYIAPAIPAIIALIFVVIHKVRVLRVPSGARVGTWMAGVALIVIAGVMLENLRPNRRLQGFGITPGAAQQTVPDEVARAAAERDALDVKLKSSGKKHLIFVRYSRNHEPAPDWVHNGADIPAEAVIWARDRGRIENRAVISYYRNREVWLLKAENRSYSLGPYTADDESAATTNQNTSR
jgi:hypothetical protein